MSEQSEQLKARTRQFVLDVFKLLPHLPPSEPGPTIRRQLAKSATSMDMNYRAACRGRSHAEFVAKLGTVAEEADESAEWLDVVDQGKLTTYAGLEPLRRESRELLAIFSASLGTARRSLREER